MRGDGHVASSAVMDSPVKGTVRRTTRRSVLPWHSGAVDQRGQVRPELDPAFLPQVRGQPGEAMAVRPGLQPGQLHEKAGVAGGYEALDSDQSSDQADQDGWATGPPRKEAGVSACRGAGNQGNADRDTRTDQPASAGTRIVHSEIDCIGDSVMGSSGVNRPPRGRRWGRGRQFWTFTLVRGVVTLWEWVNRVNRMQLTPSGCPFIVRAIPQGHMVGGISLIWAIPIKTHKNDKRK